MKRWLCYAVTVFTLLAPAPRPVQAGGGLTGFATEWTQIANNLQLIEVAAREAQQVANQLTQIDYLLKSTLRLSGSEWGQVMTQLEALANVVQQGQALAYSLSNIDEQFNDRFSDFATFAAGTLDYRAYREQVQSWSATSRDTLRGALQAAGLQWQQMADERSRMHVLQGMSDNAVGQTQALQAGNQIAGQQVEQLQKLRQLTMTQLQLQSTYLATRQEQEDYYAARREQLRGTRNTVIGDEAGFTGF